MSVCGLNFVSVVYPMNKFFLFCLSILSFLLSACSGPIADDPGKNILFLLGEHEYGTPESLPKFAKQHLDPLGYESQFIFAAGNDRNSEDCHTFEGIIPALETSHAIIYAIKLAKELGPGKDLVINMSGRGDKDMPQVAKIMGVEI